MRLFITDIDDTLTVGESVSGEVRAAFARLRAAGWDVMVATGRTWGLARRHMEAVGVTAPSILYNGSRVADPRGRFLHSTPMPADLAARVLSYVWALPAEVQATGDERLYCREGDVDTRAFYAPGGPVELLSEPILPAPVYRIGLWMDPGRLEGIERDLQGRFGGEAAVWAGGPRSLDIQAKGVSKGSCLDYVLKNFLSQRPERIVAAGDHRNDLELLKRADIAAAPANACEEVLDAADFVYPEAGRGGICQLIEYLLA